MSLPCHNRAVLLTRLGRVLVAICLLGWLAPAGASFAVLIHLATDATTAPTTPDRWRLPPRTGTGTTLASPSTTMSAVRQSSVDPGAAGARRLRPGFAPQLDLRLVRRSSRLSAADRVAAPLPA